MAVILAAIVSNYVHAAVLALATASIGAIFSSTATDMGTQARVAFCWSCFNADSAAQGILDRYRQIQPKFIFSETEVVYGGKTIDLIPKITDVARDLVSRGLLKVILLPSTKTKQEITAPHVANWSDTDASLTRSTRC